MSQIYDQIKGAFAFMDAPFAVHPKDQQRAAAYRDAAVAAGLSWADAENDVRAYAAEQSWTAAETEKQVERAARFLRPTLG